MNVPPLLNDEEIARKLRDMKKEMPILRMERLSGVNRQVLYRIMGGTSVNRSPYEIVVKVLTFLETHGSKRTPNHLEPIEITLTQDD